MMLKATLKILKIQNESVFVFRSCNFQLKFTIDFRQKLSCSSSKLNKNWTRNHKNIVPVPIILAIFKLGLNSDCSHSSLLKVVAISYSHKRSFVFIDIYIYYIQKINNLINQISIRAFMTVSICWTLGDF